MPGCCAELNCFAELAVGLAVGLAESLMWIEIELVVLAGCATGCGGAAGDLAHRLNGQGLQERTMVSRSCKLRGSVTCQELLLRCCASLDNAHPSPPRLPAVLSSPRGHPFSSTPVAQRGGFWSYVAGTAYRILVSHAVGGLEIDNYRTTLPMSKGLSSSAAVCVLVRGTRQGAASAPAQCDTQAVLCDTVHRLCMPVVVRGVGMWRACRHHSSENSHSTIGWGALGTAVPLPTHPLLLTLVDAACRPPPPLPPAHGTSLHWHCIRCHGNGSQVARAFNSAYDLRLTTRGEMEFAYLGEVTTPSKCGEPDPDLHPYLDLDPDLDPFLDLAGTTSLLTAQAMIYSTCLRNVFAGRPPGLYVCGNKHAGCCLDGYPGLRPRPAPLAPPLASPPQAAWTRRARTAPSPSS